MRWIYVDIDGTIGDCSHRLKHYEDKDWQTFFSSAIDDGTHEDIIELVSILSLTHKVIINTGRPEHMREVTVQWLDKHAIPYDYLYMRPDKDFREDSIVKIETLERIMLEVTDGTFPEFALEDRNRVVKALRDYGVRVLHVADGDY